MSNVAVISDVAEEKNATSHVIALRSRATSASVEPSRSEKLHRSRRPARPTVSVIVPTLNEAANIPFVLSTLAQITAEVIIVDGRSRDDTVRVATALRPDVIVVREQRRGKGAALRAGFAAATGDIIVMLDSDGSADGREIPRFIDALQAGADFAKGTRFALGGGSADITGARQLGNAALSGLVNVVFGATFTDLCYGYNAFWRDCLPYLNVDCDGFEVETLLNVRAVKSGLRIAEVPSFESNRIHGSSNLHAIKDGLRVLRTIVSECRPNQYLRSAAQPRRSSVPEPAVATPISHGGQS